MSTALLLMLTSCRDQPAAQGREADAAPQQPAVDVPTLEVGVSGCSGLVEDSTRGLVCLTRPAKQNKPIHLWLDGVTDPQVGVLFDGETIIGDIAIDPEGILISVELPKREGRLELNTDHGRWSIELQSVSDRFEALRKAVQASWRANSVTALEDLGRQQETLDEPEAALLGCLGARLALAGGDIEHAVMIASQVSTSKSPSCAGRAQLLVAYVELYLRPDFNSAEGHLKAAEANRGVDLDTRIGAAYLRGVFEHRVGQVDESLLSFQRAARLARLIRDDDQLASALIMEAVTLARLGRFTEAEALVREVEAQAPKLEHQKIALDLRSSVAWIAVLRREDDPGAPDPVEALREVIATYALQGDRRNLANRRLDLSLALVQNGDLDGAEAQLAELDPDALDPDLLVWFELTSARIDQMRGRFRRAQAHLERGQVLAELNQDRELEWRVEISWAELERSRGKPGAAIQRFRVASEIADTLALSIAGDAGRSRFVTTHSRADVALTELLLERGDNREAMCTAMAARARHLRGLWARLRPPLLPDAERRYRELLSRHHDRKQAIATTLERSWELSTTELKALREQVSVEGERADSLLAEATAMLEAGAPNWSCERALPNQQGDAVLTMMPRADGRHWVAMLARIAPDRALHISTVDVDIADPELAGAEVLDQFADALEGARRLRVIPVGAFMTVDFHELSIARSESGPTISYSLGLGTPIDEDTIDPSAAVIAGADNLAAVADEASVVAERIAEFGWSVDRRWSPSSESQPGLLHYAGHGQTGDELGWRSAVELPDIGKVSAAQIVAAQHSPELVVLGACSAGRVNAKSLDGGMNLAAAFLLAGARLVIAPVHDVDDATSLELARGLYRDFDANDPESLARALTRLQRDQRSRGAVLSSAESFTSWRVWTP